MVSLTELGLVSIVVAWVLQYFHSSKKLELTPLFLIFYSLGSGIIAWDSYQNGNLIISLLNLSTFVVPVALLIKTNR